MKKIFAFILIVGLGGFLLFSTDISAANKEALHTSKESNSNDLTSDIEDSKNTIDNNFKLKDDNHTFTITYGDLEGKKVKGACGTAECTKIYYLGQSINSEQYYVNYDTNRYLYADVSQDYEHNNIININFDIYVYDETSNVLIPATTANERADLDYLSYYTHVNATLPTDSLKYINMDKIQELDKQIIFTKEPQPLDEKTKGGPINIITYEDFLATF